MIQIKIYTVPILGGEQENEKLNAFLRSHKVLQVKQQMVEQELMAYWCFSIKYTEDYKLTGKKRGDVDYKEKLSPEAFGRFEAYRKIRKSIAQEEGVPAFVIFTDQELAGLAELPEVTAKSMQKVKGIGEKKAEKYGRYFFKKGNIDEAEK